ncbi:MAG: NHL repeat-containing protein [Anaerolineae bacterium]|nr:NHL repeat-containing protein [Anaerolineae bacterium]
MAKSPEHFECPSCGASLDNVDFTKPTAKCVYCGQTITIPEKLRQKPDSAAFAGFDASYVSPLVIDVSGYQKTARRTAGCGGVMGCLIGIVALVFGIGITAYFVLDPVNGVSSFMGEFNTAIAPALNAATTRTPTPDPVALRFGGEGKGNGKFEDPRSMALDGRGNIYVANYTDGRVQQFSEAGDFRNSFLLKMDIKGAPTLCISADRKGVLYVCREGEIRRINAETGKEIDRIKVKDIYNYEEVTFMPNGELVAVSYDDLVFFDAEGEVISVIKDFLYEISGVQQSGLDLAVNGVGDIYVLSERENAVYIFDETGKYKDKFGQEGEDPGDFDTSASAIAIDSVGRIYVADWSKVNIFTAEGKYLTSFEYDKGVITELEFNAKDQLFAAVNINEIYRFDVASLVKLP